MKTYDEVQAEVLKRGFEVDFYSFIPDQYGLTVCLVSQGVSILMEEYQEDFTPYLYRAFSRFSKGDFGTFFDGYDEKPFVGYEYGCYESPLGDTPNTGGLMIHRESDNIFGQHIVVYLHFEQ